MGKRRTWLVLIALFVGGAVPIQLVTLSFGYAQYVRGVTMGPRVFAVAHEFASWYVPLVYIPALLILAAVALYSRRRYPDLYRRIVVGFVFGVVATLALGAVGAAASAADVINERQEAMEGVYDAMKSFAAIAKGEAPFDAGVVQKNATSMKDHLQEASRLFPEGSGKGDIETWAMPAIWSNHADFVLKFEKAQVAAEAMKSVTEESAFRPAMGKLGNSCKSCHTDYRRPKK